MNMHSHDFFRHECTWLWMYILMNVHGPESTSSWTYMVINVHSHECTWSWVYMGPPASWSHPTSQGTQQDAWSLFGRMIHSGVNHPCLMSRFNWRCGVVSEYMLINGHGPKSTSSWTYMVMNFMVMNVHGHECTWSWMYMVLKLQAHEHTWS